MIISSFLEIFQNESDFDEDNKHFHSENGPKKLILFDFEILRYASIFSYFHDNPWFLNSIREGILLYRWIERRSMGGICIVMDHSRLHVFSARIHEVMQI